MVAPALSSCFSSIASPTQSGGVSSRGFAQQSGQKAQLEAAAAGRWEGMEAPSPSCANQNVAGCQVISYQASYPI